MCPGSTIFSNRVSHPYLRDVKREGQRGRSKGSEEGKGCEEGKECEEGRSLRHVARVGTRVLIDTSEHCEQEHDDKSTG